jgi:hypothetical protein
MAPYSGKYKTSCDICGIRVGQRTKKGKRARVWSYREGGKMRGRCKKHLDT